MKRLRLVPVILMLAAAVLLQACGTEERNPSPEEIAEKSAAAVADSTSFAFRIETSGSPAYLGPGNTMALNWVDGVLRRPSDVEATLNVAAMSAVFELEFISLEGQQYWTNPFTKKWETISGDLGYSPAVLFDPEQGMAGVVRKINDLSLVGRESVDGRDSYHIQGVIAGEDIREMTAGTITGDRIKIDLWSGVDDYRPVRLRMEQPEAEGKKPTVWNLNLSRYDEPVSIEPPA